MYYRCLYYLSPVPYIDAPMTKIYDVHYPPGNHRITCWGRGLTSGGRALGAWTRVCSP